MFKIKTEEWAKECPKEMGSTLVQVKDREISDDLLLIKGINEVKSISDNLILVIYDLDLLNGEQVRDFADWIETDSVEFFMLAEQNDLVKIFDEDGELIED